ncbi:hypothetical protein HYH03_012731 [Edaphochlamys debaryana]|uniref:Uncharacterized protein n=1 Tax=Edaphochlamys debaryana TaxID=47281 RepID=A0A835XPJ3_9CHLO|nr:hypothetical protein HYH03_012731 [Edaphochlamys debaryana]|eukprot:KAG2488732.1 hypothetical protein HYH03_012731 [Edaphochlamys debaryana]
MSSRGCKPSCLVLRLLSGSEDLRLDRGLATLRGLAAATAPDSTHEASVAGDGSQERSGVGPGGAAQGRSGGPLSVRLQGVPLTPELRAALAALTPRLRALKLYAYDLAHGAGRGAGRDGAGGEGGGGQEEGGGVAALLCRFAPSLQELTLQDCGERTAGPGGPEDGAMPTPSALPPVGNVLSTLRGLRELRHLGLRGHAPSTLLAALLDADPGLQLSSVDARHNIAQPDAAEPSASEPGPPLPLPCPLLARLPLASLKLQLPLPEGGVAQLAAVLRQLGGLTRLHLGSRLGLDRLEPLLPLPGGLRDLDLGTVAVAQAEDLEALAALGSLTRLSLAALSVAASPMGEARTSGNGAEVEAAVEKASGWLPLPPCLAELSVAEPLHPATLLALRAPACLRTLRTTGFTSAAALAEAVAWLRGRFAYRDLGIELHIGFSTTAPPGGAALPAALPFMRRRPYLAAPPLGPAHGQWLSGLRALRLQGLELAGLQLEEVDVAVLAEALAASLEDLRLDCRYPPSALPRLAALRRLRRLLLNAAFWGDGPAAARGSAELPPTGADASPGTLEAALVELCEQAPVGLYDLALATYGRSAAKQAAMAAVVAVEDRVPRVCCGALRAWVCP